MNEATGARPPRLGDRVAALLGLPHGPGSTPSPRPGPGAPDEVVDVVVVGSGGAAMAAAAGAVAMGAATAVFEKGPVPGGTTACSGGVSHIYQNVVMREAGIEDPREDALAYMARVSRPGAYDPDAPAFGLLPDEFALLEAYYDHGAAVTDRLRALGAADLSAPWLSWDGEMWPDYFEFEENKAVRGRGLQAKTPDGGSGNGGELCWQLSEYAARAGTEIRLGHRVVELTMADGRVSGVVVDDGSRCRRIGARGGVVFGSGGFAHDPELRERLLRGPVAGGSGNPTNTGDLMAMAASVGAAFGGTQNGWWNQQVLEAVDDYANSVLDVWAVPGDSMVLVNRFGRRAVDEKREYESRGRVHHIYEHDEYVNRVMFMVYDERTAMRFGGIYPIPAYGAVADHVVSAEGVDGLGAAIAERLENRARAIMPTGIAPVRLDHTFAENLRATLARFNAMAEAGVDEDYHRGEKAVEFAFHGPPAADHNLPNKLMYPLDTTGRLFAILLVGCAFDTNSGPRTTAHGQIIDASATPIAGLYGAGNCVASVFGEGYPGGGATIGPGVVFGFRAGVHAADAAKAGAGA